MEQRSIARAWRSAMSAARACQPRQASGTPSSPASRFAPWARAAWCIPSIHMRRLRMRTCGCYGARRRGLVVRRRLRSDARVSVRRRCAHLARGGARRLRSGGASRLCAAQGFTPPRGEIVVQSALTGNDKVTITIADTGCGIPAGHEEKVFLKFHRAPSPVQEGAGLGLAVSKSLVELHGGNIWVESEPGPRQ